MLPAPAHGQQSKSWPLVARPVEGICSHDHHDAHLVGDAAMRFCACVPSATGRFAVGTLLHHFY